SQNKILRPLAERVLKEDIQTLHESVSKLSEAVLELRAEERGWMNVSQTFVPWELSGQDRQKVIEKVRDMYKRNPLAGQIVDLKRYFTMGQGIGFKAEDPEVNEVLKAFWKDESNKWFQRQSQLSDDLEIDGEFFLRFFTSDITGRIQVRCIPAWQITDIITDQDDSEKPLFYRREWVEQRWDTGSKMYAIVKHHTGVEADYIPADEILHVKIGAPLYSRFGNSPLYRVINWMDAYKEWLEDRVKLNKAKATFAWKKKVKSPMGALAGMASAVTATLNKVISGTTAVTPPKTGGVIVENDAVEWSVVNTTIGADDASEDGRAIKLMICAGSGVFEHYLGDAKVGNLASTKSMELPMLKMLEWRQKLFEEAVFLPVFQRVIRAAIEAGILPEKVKVTRQENGKEIELEIPAEQVHIDIDFPPLVLKEIKDLTDALIKQVQEGLKSKQTAGMEIGVEDWEQEKTMMAAEREEDAARRREDDTNLYPPFTPPGNGKAKGKGPNGGADDDAA
ncbi:MAG: phage portal protein, partial [Bacillota bacterium]